MTPMTSEVTTGQALHAAAAQPASLAGRWVLIVLCSMLGLVSGAVVGVIVGVFTGLIPFSC